MKYLGWKLLDRNGHGQNGIDYFNLQVSSVVHNIHPSKLMDVPAVRTSKHNLTREWWDMQLVRCFGMKYEEWSQQVCMDCASVQL